MRILKAAVKLMYRMLAAAAGIAAAVWIFSCFMVVEVEGAYMMPTLEPGQKVLVSLYDRDAAESLTTGDIVVCEAPFYEIDGQGKYLVRRVTGVRDKWIEVDCDAGIVTDSADIIDKEQVLGKVILTWERKNAS